jgi:hypothetical protein
MGRHTRRQRRSFIQGSNHVRHPLTKFFYTHVITYIDTYRPHICSTIHHIFVVVSELISRKIFSDTFCRYLGASVFQNYSNLCIVIFVSSFSYHHFRTISSSSPRYWLSNPAKYFICLFRFRGAETYIPQAIDKSSWVKIRGPPTLSVKKRPMSRYSMHMHGVRKQLTKVISSLSGFFVNFAYAHLCIYNRGDTREFCMKLGHPKSEQRRQRYKPLKIKGVFRIWSVLPSFAINANVEIVKFDCFTQRSAAI